MHHALSPACLSILCRHSAAPGSQSCAHVHACACCVQELFQLLMRQLFDPAYGMFVAHESTRLYWFRPSSMDLHMEVRDSSITNQLALGFPEEPRVLH